MVRGPRIGVSALVALALVCSACTFLLDFDGEELTSIDGSLVSGTCTLDDENDSFQNPASIAAGLTGNLTVCSTSDVDYFAFSLASNQRFSISVAFDDSASANLDIRVLNSAQESFATESAIGSPANISLGPGDAGYPGAGMYVIEVFAAPPIDSLDYTLDLTISNPLPDAGPIADASPDAA